MVCLHLKTWHLSISYLTEIQGPYYLLECNIWRFISRAIHIERAHICWQIQTFLLPLLFCMILNIRFRADCHHLIITHLTFALCLTDRSQSSANYSNRLLLVWYDVLLNSNCVPITLNVICRFDLCCVVSLIFASKSCSILLWGSLNIRKILPILTLFITFGTSLIQPVNPSCLWRNARILLVSRVLVHHCQTWFGTLVIFTSIYAASRPYRNILFWKHRGCSSIFLINFNYILCISHIFRRTLAWSAGPNRRISSFESTWKFNFGRFCSYILASCHLLALFSLKVFDCSITSLRFFVADWRNCGHFLLYLRLDGFHEDLVFGFVWNLFSFHARTSRNHSIILIFSPTVSTLKYENVVFDRVKRVVIRNVESFGCGLLLLHPLQLLAVVVYLWLGGILENLYLRSFYGGVNRARLLRNSLPNRGGSLINRAVLV